MLTKIRQELPREDYEKVLTLLDEYGVEPWERNARDRVQLAIIKASEGNMEALAYWLQVAKSDFRDVLVAAEYPKFRRTERELGVGGFDALGMDKQKAIEDADLQQYQQWLQKGYENDT